jgi:two-component system chemotaxis sensor kinase CheA
MMDALRESYREEARELLEQLESALLELESSPQDPEAIGRVFRSMHTIKGSGAMFGFERIASFTHEVETVFDQVRSGRLAATHSLISLTLDARDHIQALLSMEFGGPAASTEEGDRLLASFRLLANSAADPRQAATPAPASPRRETAHYRIRFRPPAAAFLNGTNPVLLLRELSTLGTCTVTAQTKDIPGLEELDPERCYLFWDVVLTTAESENAIRDVFLFVEDECELVIARVDALGPDSSAAPRLGEILIERSDLARAQVHEALRDQKRLGEMLVGRRQVHPDVVRSALAEQDHLRRHQEDQSRSESVASIRVPAAKLDSLVNSVGELVTAQARLTRLAGASGDPELEFVAEEMDRLIDRLRSDTMSVRMLPIGATFARFRRLVRDLSRELGKQVELSAEGGDTELEKNVIEQLSDPLVHIVRNAIDHGIETPAERLAAGKPELGTVRLSAAHSGAHVLIHVSDDGVGLDPARILAKAVEKGLAAPGQDLPEAEIFRFIFHPGFSTAREVTPVSGRGVGLDVVDRAIRGLRGSVDVRSRPGGGTLFTLKLPLTLAIVDGLLVSVAGEYFVLPVAKHPGVRGTGAAGTTQDKWPGHRHRP